MKHKRKVAQTASYPVTIQTPYGVLRLEYKMVSCADCGDPHGIVSYVESSPRLRSAEALPFVESLPELLLNLGRVADLAIATDILLNSAAARRA